MKIIINGKEFETETKELTYEWIVETAFGNDREDYTVTFAYTKSDKKGGRLMPGDFIEYEDGLVINVADTRGA